MLLGEACVWCMHQKFLQHPKCEQVSSTQGSQAQKHTTCPRKDIKGNQVNYCVLCISVLCCPVLYYPVHR